MALTTIRTALATWQSGPAFITESFRGTLASILRNQASNKNQKMILITSPGPAEGKTTVVQNLGIALAESGRKVLLVDADFRRPHLHRKFSLPNEWGLDRRAVRRPALERLLARTDGCVYRLPRLVDSPQPGHPPQHIQSALLAPACEPSWTRWCTVTTW